MRGQQNPVRRFRNKQGGYIGIGARRVINGGQTWAQRIRALLDGSDVYAPLTHSAVPTRGSLTPSFTRATTETGQKWDDNGYLDFTALAGEIVFKGARRERNILTVTSEDFSNVAWAKTNCTASYGATDPDGGATAWTITATAPTADFYRPVTVIAGITVQDSFYLRRRTGTGAVSLIKAGVALEAVALTTTWQRFGVASLNVTTTAYCGIEIATSGDAVDIWHPSLNDITGETDQTTIRPYVSVGVLSAPAYHGSMVDGVKCYDTDRLGNPIATTGSYPIVGYVPWEARTNLCLYSNAGTDSTAIGASLLTYTNAGAPDGTSTAQKFLEDATTVAHGAYQPSTLNYAITNSTAYTWSCFVKGGLGRTWVRMSAYDGADHFSYFDIANGVTGTNAAGNTSTITPYGANGWYRITITRTTGGASLNAGAIGAGPTSADNTPTYAGDITKGIYRFGLQIELGSFATPYIPTTTVAVARNASVLTYTGAISASEGTVYAELSTAFAVASGYKDAISSAAGTGASILGISTAAASTTRFSSDSTTLTVKTGLSDMNTGARKTAVSWGGSTSLLTGDGVTPTSSAFDGTMNVTASFGIGCNALGTGNWSGNIRNVRIWNRKLSASELQAITA